MITPHLPAFRVNRHKITCNHEFVFSYSAINLRILIPFSDPRHQRLLRHQRDQKDQTDR